MVEAISFCLPDDKPCASSQAQTFVQGPKGVSWTHNRWPL